VFSCTYNFVAPEGLSIYLPVNPVINLKTYPSKCSTVTYSRNLSLNHQLVVENSCTYYPYSSFERVDEFKYLGTALTNQNSIQEEIKSRLKSGNACYHSVQNLLSSSLLYKNLKIKIYRTIILPVVLYGCETWSLTLREERRLRVFEKRVLRRIFGPKRDEVTGEWKKLHNEELNKLYSLPNIVRVIKSRRMRWAEHVARMGEGRDVYGILVGKPEGRRPLGRPRRRWEDNSRMDLREVGCRCVD